jgi:eukaryotic-like serine/threonine-protein kinase
MIGQTISHFRILEKLGEGGMGVVYKAEDLKLTRMVALKFLPHGPEAHEPERTRFLQEARAAAILNHPNVCTVYDIKEEDGQQFIAMEYVEGVTLTEKILEGVRRQAPCHRDTAMIQYAIQIAEALQEAHSHGIVHRDVKPDNIMVNTKNQVKVMDFGLARLKGSLKLTKTSSTVGTLAYMAPEQIQGGEVDARSDIFSFGIVLYEMLTGHLPFRGEHEAAMLYSILNEDPQPLSRFRTDVPEYLASIIERALQKDSANRYQAVGDLLSDLKSADASSSERLRLTRKQHSIAVLPFGNLSADAEQEYFCDGLAEEIITRLSHVDDLRVVARTSAFSFKDKQEDIRAIGRKLNAESVLEGSVRKSGNRLRITAQLINVADGFHLWAEKFDRTLEDIFTIQDEISLAIVGNLKVTLLQGEQAKLVKHRTSDPDAYNLYMKGRYFFNQRKEPGIRKSIECYSEAIGRDPEFALAYTGLAESYLFLGDFRAMPLAVAYNEARKAAMTALQLDDTLAEVHLVCGEIKLFCDWDWAAAEHELTRALTINPACAEAHHMYAHYLELHGQFEHALSEMHRSMDLEPVAPSLHACLVQVLFYARRYGESIKECSVAMEMAPQFFGLYGWLGIARVQCGAIDLGIEALQNGLHHLPSDPRLMALLGYAFARAGKESEAKECLAALVALGEKRYVDPYFMSWIHGAGGDPIAACSWLRKAYDEHSEWLPWLGVDALVDSLRDRPDFKQLLNDVKLGT